MPRADQRIVRWTEPTWQASCSKTLVNTRDQIDQSLPTCEFYNERKWCDQCGTYVRYLMSVNHSYCIDCGQRVRLFNRNDTAGFQDRVQRHKWQAS